MKALREANEWLFGYGSPVTFGLFRVLMGGVIFANLLFVALDFDAWFSERGYVPWAVADRWMGHEIPRFNLIAGVTDTRVVVGFYALVTLAAFCTMIGLWTRVSSIVLALGLISLHHRNPIILHGGDTAIRAAAIYLAIGPSGAACSLDRLIALWRGKATSPHAEVSLWPQRLVQIQLAIIYITTVWAKWQGSRWRDGTATWYPANLREFERFWVPDFLNQQPFLAITTYGTLLVELALGTLVFYRPLRKWVLLAGLMLHGYIEWAMNIPLFAFAMCSMYVAFYQGEEVVGWARRLGDRLARFRLRVRLPKDRDFAEGPGLTIAATDPLGLVEYEKGDGPWTAFDAHGRPRRAKLASWQRSMGAWPLFWCWSRLLDAALTRRDEGSERASARPVKTKSRAGSAS